jgi:two-component system, NarL family, sensor histidine kinase DesK
MSGGPGGPRTAGTAGSGHDGAVPASYRDPAPSPDGPARHEAGPAGCQAGRGEYLADDELSRDVSSWQRRRRWIVGSLVAAFVISPTVALVAGHGFTGKAVFLVPATAVFVAAMGRNMLTAEPAWQVPGRGAGWVALIAVLGSAIFAVGGMDWLVTLAVAAAMFGNLLVTTRLAIGGIAGCCAVGLGISAWHGFGYGNTLAATATPALAGLLAYTAARRNDLVTRLNRARVELARMAVAEERLRIARDLHDLLGHSLSLISLKAELAGRLIGADTTRAAREIAELESVARRSLSEVREAVTSYRQPTVAAEVAAARRLLTSAGVDCQVSMPAEYSLPPALDALLAWTVREGATNIMRHAAARHAEISIELAGGRAAAALTDDGAGPPARPATGDAGSGLGTPPGLAGGSGLGTPPGLAGGSGLAGLAERAARLGGTLSAGAGPRGGFRLLVSAPLAAVIPDRADGAPADNGRVHI